MRRGSLAFLLALGACAGSSTPSDTGTDQIAHGARVHPMPMRGRIVPPPSEDPSFTYYGGPVLGQAKVIEVLWGPNVAYATELGQFYARIVGSEYFDLLGEYGTQAQTVGRGTFEGLVTDPTPPAGHMVEDQTIQDELARMLHEKLLPENDENTLYIVHFPPGISIMQGGAASCTNFCAYHGTFQRNGKLVPYAVIPDMEAGCAVGCGMGDKLANTTLVASHELAQAVTDPAIGFVKEAAAPLAWFDPAIGEISDACGGTATLVGFTVQTQWSRKDASCRFGNPGDTFTLAVSPTAQTVTAGTSATLVVSTTAIGPRPPTVMLAASGLPSGVTASFDSTSVVAGASAVLTLAAADDAASGESDLLITGTAGGASKTIKAHITVESSKPGNDFTLAVSPAGRTVERGSSVTFMVETSVLSGGAEPLMLAAAGLPDGASASFAPPTVTSGETSQLTISAAADATLGSSLVTITATGASASHSATVSLDVEDVPPVNDYMIALSPSLRQVTAGTTVTYTVTSMVLSGSPQSIALSASGLPSGITAAFAPTSIAAGDSATLTLSVPEQTGAVTEQPFTVTGTADAGTRTATAALTVVPAPPTNDFSVTLSPASGTVVAGDAASFTVRTAVTSGSAVPVSFAISGLPAGVTATFSPTSVTAGASAKLQVSAALTAAPGDVALTVTGASSTTSHDATLDLTVAPPPPNDFSISIAPAAQTLGAGSSTDYVVSTTKTSGQAETIALSVSGLPSGVTASLSPASVTAGGTSTLTLTAAGDAAAATATFTVTGDAASQSHDATADVTVTALPPPDDFSIGVTPSTDTVLPGDSVSYTITTAVTSGAAQSIAISVDGLPDGVTAEIDPQSVTAGDSATLTLTASAGAPAAQKTFTVSGVAASGTHVATASLEVLPPPIVDLIQNGGFETGDLSGWLTDPDNVSAAVNVANAHHSGDHSARLGSQTSVKNTTSMYQTVAVPATGTTTLTFWYQPHCPNDNYIGEQWAVIANADVTVPLQTIFDYWWPCQDSTSWLQKTVDLSGFAGQTIAVYFYTDDRGSSDTAWMYIDDVSVVNQ